jgi:hypothetical protein
MILPIFIRFEFVFNTEYADLGILFLTITLGIYKKSRAVSILGFALYIINRIFIWIKFSHTPVGIIIFFIVVLILIASIRGVVFYHKLRKSHIVKKNVIILNLLAMLYSIIAVFAVSYPAAYFFPNRFFEVINEEVLFKNEIYSLGVLVYYSFAITYILSLMKLLPFTRKRETVYYEISEEDLKNVENNEDGNKELQKSILDRGRLDG